MNHKCPVEGCGLLLQSGKLMCAFHWGMLPKWLQNAVYREWNNGNILPNYMALRQQAIDMVGILDKVYKEARP